MSGWIHKEIWTEQRRHRHDLGRILASHSVLFSILSFFKTRRLITLLSDHGLRQTGVADNPSIGQFIFGQSFVHYRQIRLPSRDHEQGLRAGAE